MVDIFPHRFRTRLLFAATLLTLIGCSEPETPAPTRPGETASAAAARRPDGDVFRIAFLGDSLSAGFGLTEAQAFPALVQDRLRRRGFPVDVLNAGVSGDTTAGGLSRVDWVLRAEPELLVVELGANDALRGQPLENIEGNLREIVRRAVASGASVLLLGMDVPTNYGASYGDGFAELYSRIAEEERVDLLDGFIREVGLDPSLMLPDGLHPTAAGHRKLAERLATEIEPMLPRPRPDPSQAPARNE